MASLPQEASFLEGLLTACGPHLGANFAAVIDYLHVHNAGDDDLSTLVHYLLQNGGGPRQGAGTGVDPAALPRMLDWIISYRHAHASGLSTVDPSHLLQQLFAQAPSRCCQVSCALDCSVLLLPLRHSRHWLTPHCHGFYPTAPIHPW